MKERYFRKAALCAAFLLIFGGFTSPATAQVAVSPVRIDLGIDNDKDVVRVNSQSDKAVSYQVEIVSWNQTGERREIYTPTEDIIAVPPLFTLEPGEEQIVRVGMMIPADPSTEKAYRLFITELASPQEAEEAPGVGVNMRLRLGIPVFVAPLALPYATLDHVDAKQMDNQLFMELRNRGNTHVRISEVRYLAPGATDPEVEFAAIYILAGQSGYVPVILPDSRRQGTVTLATDTLGAVEYDLSPAL